MSSKQKIFIIILLLALFSVLRGCVNLITGGYSEEVSTVLSTSHGFTVEETTFFTARYRLFRHPEGIRRFPDGGQAKELYEAVYIISVTNGKLNSIAALSDSGLSESDIVYTKGIRDNKDLKLLISGITGDNNYIIDCSSQILEVEKIGDKEAGRPEFIEPSINYKDVKNIFISLIGNPDSGIPSPLEYTDKRKEQLIKDVIRLKGDYYYRKAVIDTLSKTEISQLLSEMIKYEESLDKDRLKYTEYAVYSEDTQDYIRERLGL